MAAFPKDMSSVPSAYGTGDPGIQAGSPSLQERQPSWSGSQSDSRLAGSLPHQLLRKLLLELLFIVPSAANYEQP